MLGSSAGCIKVMAIENHGCQYQYADSLKNAVRPEEAHMHIKGR